MSNSAYPVVRVRISAPDPFHGLSGHEYIQARGLAKRISRANTPLPPAECQCEPCVRARLLPTIQRICSPNERRRTPALQEIPWNDLANDSVLAELDAPTVTGD